MSTSGNSQQYTSEFITQEDEEDYESDKQNGSNYMLREQDRFLPICNIIKIMKITVPDNGKVAKDARECIQETVSEFISFITSEAIEHSIEENRKTVNGDDLLFAFSNLGFDNYVGPLTAYLNKFREATKSDRNLYSEANLQEDDASSKITITSSKTKCITSTAINSRSINNINKNERIGAATYFSNNDLNIPQTQSFTIIPTTDYTNNNSATESLNTSSAITYYLNCWK